jgi:hypothetical protein
LGESENGSVSSATCSVDDPTMSSPSDIMKKTAEPDLILSDAMKNLASSATFHDATATDEEHGGSDAEKSAPHEAVTVTVRLLEPESSLAVPCEISVAEDAEVSDLKSSEAVPMVNAPSQRPEEKSFAAEEEQSTPGTSSGETVTAPLLDEESRCDTGRENLTSNCFGGSGGKAFDSGRGRGQIAEISVNAGALVDGITVTYEDHSVCAYGGSGGSSEKLALGGDEFVDKIHIRYSRTIVQCMTFVTTKRRQLGPCGGIGSLFLLCDNGPSEEEVINAPDGCMLVGIKGRAGDLLDSIGFHWAPIRADALSRDMPMITRTQVFGGSGGKAFDFRDMPNKPHRISGITINAGNIVDGITITRTHDVRSVGGVSESAKTLYLEEDEFIEEVHVRCNKAIVQCLTFKTNFGRQLGPCGGNGGLFLMGGIGGRDVVLKPPADQKLVGIQGRAGRYLDSIAFYWGPVQN